MLVLDWGEHEIMTARMALAQLAMFTDTGAERGLIARMISDLSEEGGDQDGVREVGLGKL